MARGVMHQGMSKRAQKKVGDGWGSNRDMAQILYTWITEQGNDI